MTIEVPDADLGALKLTSTEARLDLAIGLYTAKRTSMGKAAKIAGISYTEFLQELGRRGISINYSIPDFEDDLKTIQSLNEKGPSDRR